MGDFVSEYGGDLVTLPLINFMRRGRGDDFLMKLDELSYGKNRCGTLTISNSSCTNDDYARAVQALDGQNEKVMLVCVEDPESASPYLFVKNIKKGGQEYVFPVIFNASLRSYAEDGVYYGSGEESYNLCLGDYIDPERKCAMRIVYAPGERIEWCEKEVEQVFSHL